MNYLIGLVLLFVIIGINVWYFRNKSLYSYAKDHIAAYTFLGLLLDVYLVFFGGLGHFFTFDTIQGLIDNVISNYIVVGVIVFLYYFEKHVKNKYEDKEKLRQDYFNLADKYRLKKNNGEYDNINNLISDGNVIYPVSSSWTGDICLYSTNERIVNKDNLTIVDSKKIYSLPSIIESNMMEIINVHDTSEVYNNINIRVLDFKAGDNCLGLVTERTYYYYSLVTNRAADYDWSGKGITVRSLYEPGPALNSLEYSLLSNHLGFNGFIKSSDGYIVFVKRKKEVSIGKRTYGDSIGASLKTKYALNENGVFTVEGLKKSILKEIEDELKITENFVETINLIQAYRDCVECGKPQLLFYSEVSQTASQISEVFFEKLKDKNNSESNGKNDKTRKDLAQSDKERQKKEDKVLVDGDKLAWINVDDIFKLKFLEDGVEFVEDEGGFFSIEDGKTKRMENQFLNMVPSASAVLIRLKEYLDKRSKRK